MPEEQEAKATPSQIIRGCVILIVFVALISGAVIWWLNYWGSRIGVPKETKLADCTNGFAQFHMKTPKGNAKYIYLVVPGIQFKSHGNATSDYAFSYKLRITNETGRLADFSSDSSRISLNGGGYVLTGIGFNNTNVPDLWQTLNSKKEFDVSITFDPPPPPGSSVWLYWTQSAHDLKQ